MDTVQMNKKIKEIMDSSDVYLLSEQTLHLKKQRQAVTSTKTES